MKENLSNIFEQITKDIFSIAEQEMISKINGIIPYLEGISEVSNIRKDAIKSEDISVNNDNETLQKFSEEIAARLNLFRNSYKTDTTNLLQHITAKNHELTDPYTNKLVQEQHRNRFAIIGDESFFWKNIKRVKNIVFRLSRVPLHIGNLFRRLFKRAPKPVKYWKHNIDLHTVAIQTIVLPFVQTLKEFETYLGEQTLQTLETLMEDVSHTMVRPYYTTHSTFDFNRWSANLTENMQQSFEKFKTTHLDKFLSDCQKSGTIELCTSPYKRTTSKKFSYTSGLFTKTSISLSMIIEETITKWSFSMRLSSINAKINVVKKEYHTSFSEKFIQSTQPPHHAIEQYLTTTKNELEALAEVKKDELRSFIVVNLYKVKKNVLPQIEKITNLQFVQQLLNSTAKLENELSQIAEQLKERDEEHQSYYKTRQQYKDLWSFAPGKYISDTVMPEYLTKMSELKREITLKMESTGTLGNDLHHILDFCFDTALDMIDTQEDSEENNSTQPWEVLNEGIDNAINKNKAIAENGNTILKLFTQSLNNNINFINKEINGLQFEKTIVDIKAKITKTQVINKTQWVLKTIKTHFDNTYSVVLSRAKSYFKLTNNFIQKTKKRLHLATPDKSITSELSNFLVETNQKTEKLPLVYKRLFELKQLDEANLFMGRKTELNTLNRAYKDWTNGNYAATIIHGENGSGKSSLQSYFASTLKSNYKIIQFKTERFFHTEQDFFELMSEILQQPFTNHEQLYEYTTELRQKLILIIDGLERLFIRKLYGNTCLHELLDFIIKTNNHFFWILTCSENTYNYLNKIYRLSDYFDYNLKIQSLSEDEILNIIFKRNRLSGYNIIFEPSVKDKTKKFNTLPPEMQQEQLEQRYFARLNQFAKSNLSIALSFWLASIDKIKDNSLYISSFKAPEFSFLTNLSTDKTNALFLIILHSKLNEDILSNTFHITHKQSERTLHLLKEDGILRYINGYYVLHPMLFRNVTELLQQKNLIH